MKCDIERKFNVHGYTNTNGGWTTAPAMVWKSTGAATDGLWTKRLIEKLLRIGCATDLHSRSYKDLFRIIKASMRVNSLLQLFAMLGKPSVLL